MRPADNDWSRISREPSVEQSFTTMIWLRTSRTVFGVELDPSREWVWAGNRIPPAVARVRRALFD